ncbi:MAG: glycosyltransferase family 2 protein [Thermoflexales bacterium]|nr:glycosyltransferase family 2 protein [Thermoflexales bacterium]
MSVQPALSVCVINHRTPALTRDCVQSVLDTAAGLPVEVWVVNNTAEPCDLSTLVVPASARVTQLQNERRLGFAANQNQMLSRATGRYLMALNSDTVVHPEALQELIAFMDAHPRCGIAGPRLQFGDGALQPSLRNFPAPLPSFVEVSGLWTRVRGKPWFASHVLLCHPHDRVVESEWLHGACYIIRPAAMAEVGAYDDQTFDMFGEDVDWCWRMRAAGWTILFDPAATVTHLEGATPYDARTEAMWDGGMRFVRKHYTRLNFLPTRIATVLALCIRWVLARNGGQRRAQGAAIRRMLAAQP